MQLSFVWTEKTGLKQEATALNGGWEKCGMRRLFIMLGLALAATLNGAETKPNILFIAVDDLKPSLGCYGDKTAITPNIDRLASRGTVFRNAHCQWAVCGPSRTSLMTGLMPETTGVTGFKKMRKKLPDLVTLPQLLRQSGYATTGVGKIYDYRCVDKGSDAQSWSIPYKKAAEPPPGVQKDRFGYQAPETRRRLEAAIAEGRKKGLSNWQSFVAKPELKMVTDCADVPDEGYKDGLVALQAVRTLGELKAAGNAFFLGVGFYKPHLPFNAPKKYWDLYDRGKLEVHPFQKQAKGSSPGFYWNSGEARGYSGFPDEGPVSEQTQRLLLHGYYACVSYIDAQVGKLLDALQKNGLAENTIIVFWGDHGFHLGDHGLWGKHTNLEQASRVPMIIVDPHSPEQVKETNSPVQFLDIYPTLCAMTGVAAPEELQGRSIKPLLFDAGADVHKGALSLFARRGWGYALRTRRYRYVEWVQNGKLLSRDLFDYESDPLETINLANDREHAALVRALSAELAGAARDTGGCLNYEQYLKKRK